MPRITTPKHSHVRVNPKRTPTISSSRAFGPKSPIIDKDIQSFLALCMGSWDSYTEEEKQGIIQSLPQSRQPQDATLKETSSDHLSNDSHVNHGGSRSAVMEGNIQALNRPLVPADFIASDTYIKHAVARFKRDIADGYYEKSWQDKAKRAYEERRQGKFDEYLNRCAEEMFASNTEESEESNYDEYESDEDFVINQKEGYKKLRTSKVAQTKAKKLPSHVTR